MRKHDWKSIILESVGKPAGDIRHVRPRSLDPLSGGELQSLHSKNGNPPYEYVGVRKPLPRAFNLTDVKNLDQAVAEIGLST